MNKIKNRIIDIAKTPPVKKSEITTQTVDCSLEIITIFCNTLKDSIKFLYRHLKNNNR